MFDCEHGIALHPMTRIRAPSSSEGEVSWVFSSYGINLGNILELWQGWPFETPVCSAALLLLFC